MTDPEKDQTPPPSPDERIDLPAANNSESSQPSLQEALSSSKELKSARKLILYANIAGPVSLILGGVILSISACICAFLAYRKLRNLSKTQGSHTVYIQQFINSSIFGIMAGLFAFALNAVSLYYLYPYIVEIIETGTYSGLTVDSSTVTNSTWG